jgi:hypothetical protein
MAGRIITITKEIKNLATSFEGYGLTDPYLTMKEQTISLADHLEYLSVIFGMRTMWYNQ